MLAISFLPTIGTREPRAARLGRRGERVAERYLRRKGLRILARNVRSGVGEIDLVALDDDTLVFVEVRSRSEGSWAGGLESIDARKAKALRRACGAYIQSMPGEVEQIRIDVVAVDFERGFLRLRVRDVNWEPGFVPFGAS